MDWRDALTEIATSHYARTGKALLLANVPKELLYRRIDIREVTAGRKLRDAILEDGGQSVRLVRNPDSPLVWGLLPASITDPGDLTGLFTAREPTEESTPKTPRFGRGVWLAFAKSLRPGFRRYLEIGPPSRFTDIAEGEMPPPAGMEVSASYIYNTTGELVPGEDHSAVVEKNIREWSAEKSVEIERLLAPSGNQFSNSISPRLNRFDVLNFSELSAAEKARILIPLDLLSKIKFEK